MGGEYDEVWFNDPDADHVHRCSEDEPHDSYHRCGHERDGVLCGIQW